METATVSSYPTTKIELTQRILILGEQDFHALDKLYASALAHLPQYMSRKANRKVEGRTREQRKQVAHERREFLVAQLAPYALERGWDPHEMAEIFFARKAEKARAGKALRDAARIKARRLVTRLEVAKSAEKKDVKARIFRSKPGKLYEAWVETYDYVADDDQVAWFTGTTKEKIVELREALTRERGYKFVREYDRFKITRESAEQRQLRDLIAQAEELNQKINALRVSLNGKQG